MGGRSNEEERSPQESKPVLGGNGEKNKPNLSPSAKSGKGPSEQCGQDRLVKIELDAAYALAELAYLPRDEGFPVQQWGGKARRSSKTNPRVDSPSYRLTAVKEEWNPVADNPSFHTILPISTDNACITLQKEVKVDTDVKEEKDCTPSNICQYVQPKDKNSEPDYDSMEPSKSRFHVSRTGSKLRPPLTEIEKEARRLRRVLANRESARQTIRRKQALCEELSQKAAELANENETIKQQTELAMQEYNSLKDRNKQLKEQVSAVQMSSTARDTIHETPPESKSSQVHSLMLTSMQIPVLSYNGIPLPPFVWAAAFAQAAAAAATAGQTCTLQNREGAIPVENNPLFSTYGMMASNLWTNLGGNSQQQVPPFFLPHVLAFSPGAQPSETRATVPPAITTGACASSAGQCEAATPVTADGAENSLVETKAVRTSKSGDLDTSHLTEMVSKSSTDKSSETSTITPETRIFGRAISDVPNITTTNPTTLSNTKDAAQGGLSPDTALLNVMDLKHGGSYLRELSNSQGFASSLNMGGHFPMCAQENYLCSGKRVSVAAAEAAEARKRRKELTKNKNIQARQLKLHC